MKAKKREEILALLKSGDFTIAYHDSGDAYLYRGRHEYDKLKSKDKVHAFDYDSEGYIPMEVQLLVEALGGKTGTT